MAGSPSSKAKKTSGKRGSQRKAPEPKPRDYAREAISEWRKAARFGAAALLASGASGAKSKADDKPPLKQRLNPATTDKGGRVGDAADNLLSRLGFLGKAASNISLGSRAVDKLVPDAISKLQPKGPGGSRNGGGDSDEIQAPVPIQESIDLAVPIEAAFALATRFEDHPQWSERIEGFEEVDEKHLAFDTRMRGVTRRVEVEIVDEQPDWRLEWDATEGNVHTGVLSFHELAPSLTHLELSMDVEPESPVQRLTRTIHLPERAIRQELHRFKAYAELWQQVEDIEPPEQPEEPEDEEVEEEPEGEEDLEDEELDEEPGDEFEDEPEDDFDEGELEEEGEPAGAR